MREGEDFYKEFTAIVIVDGLQNFLTKENDGQDKNSKFYTRLTMIAGLPLIRRKCAFIIPCCTSTITVPIRSFIAFSFSNLFPNSEPTPEHETNVRGNSVAFLTCLSQPRPGKDTKLYCSYPEIPNICLKLFLYIVAPAPGRGRHCETYHYCPAAVRSEESLRFHGSSDVGKACHPCLQCDVAGSG